MKHIFLFFFGLFFISPSFAQPIVFVTPSGAGDNSGTSWTNALPGGALSYKMPMAAEGTQFWITTGTYETDISFSEGFIFQNGLEVYGGFAGTETMIEERVSGINETIFAGVHYNQFSSNSSIIRFGFGRGNQNLVIDAITIRDGHNNTFGAGIVGTMIFSKANILISNCRFINNISSDAGALHIIASDSAICNLTIKNCSFTGNSGIAGGALGIFAYSLSASMESVVEDCVFAENIGNSIYTSSSGAISCVGNFSPNTSIKIKRCMFLNNTALQVGGAMSISQINCEIENCIFNNNNVTGTNGEGGVLFGEFSRTVFKNCIFKNNSAAYGGVVHNLGYGYYPTTQFFLNCNFINNSALKSGGVFHEDISQRLDALNTNTIDLKNCIVWNNTAPINPVFTPQIQNIPSGNQLRSTFASTYSLIQGNYPGTGNIDTDPLFVDASNGDYHLSPNSPAINAGDPNTTDLPSTDLAGQPRVQGGRVDMGAYEFFSCLVAPCIPISIQRSK